MKYSIKITDNFLEDLDKILSYISEDLLNPLAATKLYRKVMAKINTLDVMPERARLFENYYSIKVVKYRVIYRIIREKRLVEIAHLVYSRRDLRKLFAK